MYTFISTWGKSYLSKAKTTVLATIKNVMKLLNKLDEHILKQHMKNLFLKAWGGIYSSSFPFGVVPGVSPGVSGVRIGDCTPVGGE